MKRPQRRARKKVHDEIKLERERILDQMLAAVIPVERLTPGMEKLAKKQFKEVGQRDRAFENIDKLSEDEALEILKKLKTAPFEMRRLFQNAAKRLPHPPGGRKKIFSVADSNKIVDEITALIREGYEPKTAKSIVALRRNVSVSTIQRVWKQRSSRAKEG